MRLANKLRLTTARVARYLLKVGARAEVQDRRGDDAMHYAARERQSEVINAIFATGKGYVEQPNREGSYPSDFAWDQETADGIVRRSMLTEQGFVAEQAREEGKDF